MFVVFLALVCVFGFVFIFRLHCGERVEVLSANVSFSGRVRHVRFTRVNDRNRFYAVHQNAIPVLLYRLRHVSTACLTACLRSCNHAYSSFEFPGKHVKLFIPIHLPSPMIIMPVGIGQGPGPGGPL